MNLFTLILISGFLILEINSLNQSKDFSEKLTYSDPEVCAKAGCVRGKVESGTVKPYDAFYGIPYAEPPVGKLRFESPAPYKGWKGYWNATYPRDSCTQRSTNFPNSEDCLYLNIYRPIHRIKDKKLPVMVWIHGGSFISFSGSPEFFGPEYLMDNGEVIVVTLNYRLGIFGFLCSGDEAVKGNFGLKDQQLALQWVASNIESFGGDQNSITLAGHSSGAAAVHLQMMNPISQALFHRVILMSGSALGPFMHPIDVPAQFRLVAKSSGLSNWDTDSTSSLAKGLKNIEASTLLTAMDDLFVLDSIPATPLRPCVEGNWEGAFMTEDPRKVWAEGRFAQKPMLLDTVSNEGINLAYLVANQTWLDTFNENIYKYLPIQMDFQQRYANDVFKFYFGKNYIDETNADKYYKMFGDRQFLYPMFTLVSQYLQYADVQKNPIFINEFGYEGPYSFVELLTGKDLNLGVGHLDNILYLFTIKILFPPFEQNTTECKMIDIYVRTIVDFIVRGEVKSWSRFNPCTPTQSTPFCDRQIFQKNEKMVPNQVNVSVSNKIDVEMVKFWSRIDNGTRYCF